MTEPHSADPHAADVPASGADAVETLAAVGATVAPADPAVRAAAEQRLAALAIPPGSLGRFGALAVRLAAATGTLPAMCGQRPTLIVAAADHGVHATGVSPWPQAITTAMAGTLAAGQATANALARAVGADVVVLDAGMATALPEAAGVLRAGVRAGTADLSTGQALSRSEAAAAVLAGMAVADAALTDGADLLLTGDMGIANTTAAACLVSALTSTDPVAAVGPGAAGPDADLTRKQDIVAQAVRRADLDPADGLGALAAFGGLEHAALAGVCLAGARARVPVLLDGVNAVAAALAAAACAPAVGDHLIAGHRSPEPGARSGLAHLGLDPVLDLAMALGEGTGALLAVPVVRAAARLLEEVATLAEIQQAGAGPLS